MTTTARAMLDLQVSEKQFQQQIVDLARRSGWICFHPYDSRRSTAGYPDLTLARIGTTPEMTWRTELIFFEVKKQTGRTTDAQAKWIALLRHVPGVVARVVRPSDWDEIVALLSRRSPRGREAT